jgi:hypothetical protein
VAIAPDGVFLLSKSEFSPMGIVNANLPPSAHLAVLDSLDPISEGAGAVNSVWVNANEFEWFMGLVDVGVMGALATVDMKFQQATDSSGTGAKDISGTPITQLTSTASPTVDANNKVAITQVRQEQLDLANGFNYIRLVTTVGVANTLVSSILFGFAPQQGPAKAYNAAKVAQVVNDV